MDDKEIDKYKVLEDNVRNTFIRVVWTHKIQEKQADIYFERYKMMEHTKIICATITSVGIISTIFSDELIIKIMTALLSFVVATVSALFSSFDYQNLINRHKKTANELLVKRDRIQDLLLKINIKNYSIEDLMNEYEKLKFGLEKIYLDAPQTTNKAVEKANIALNMKKDNDFTESEIDNNLPKSLRKDGENSECK